MRCSRRQRDNGGQLIVVDPSARLRRGQHCRLVAPLWGRLWCWTSSRPTSTRNTPARAGCAEAEGFSVAPYLILLTKESAYMTTTTLGHEKGPVKATITDLTVADGASKDDQFCWAGPTSGDSTVAAPAKVATGRNRCLTAGYCFAWLGASPSACICLPGPSTNGCPVRR